MKLSIDICGGVSAPVVFIFDVFIHILLEANATEVIEVVIRYISFFKVYRKRIGGYIVIDWRSSILVSN